MSGNIGVKNGVLMMILDLTRTVADLWYADHKPEEDS